MTSMMEIFAAEARAEGWAEGRAKGRAEMLIQQLGYKFGSLPDWVPEKVNGGSIEDLKTWGKRLLIAATLDELFR